MTIEDYLRDRLLFCISFLGMSLKDAWTVPDGDIEWLIDYYSREKRTDTFTDFQVDQALEILRLKNEQR